MIRQRCQKEGASGRFTRMWEDPEDPEGPEEVAHPKYSKKAEEMRERHTKCGWGG